MFESHQFESHQKSTGTQYTATVALALVAFVASPAALIFSRPISYTTGAVALAVTLLCAGLAWAQWRGHSELSIPSIGKQRSK